MIAGISVAGIAVVLLLAFVLYAMIYKRKKVEKASLPAASGDQHMQPGQGNTYWFWINHIMFSF